MGAPSEIKYLTVAQVAELEGVSVSTIRARCKAGRFEGAWQLPRSGMWRIPNPDYDEATAYKPRTYPAAPAVTLDERIAAALADLAPNHRRPARAAAVGLQTLSRLYREHSTRTPEGACGGCYWPAPCATNVRARTAVEAVLVELGADV
jgi:hypothetical protein